MNIFPPCWTPHHLFAPVLALILIVGCQTPPPDPAAELKPIVDAYVESWNTGNVDALDAIVDAGVQRHVSPTLPSAATSLDELKQVITNVRAQFPDFHVSLDEEIYIAGKSAIRWTVTATHTGSTEELPATGKAVSVSGSSIAHYAEGKLTEEWVHTDNQDFMQQLGFSLVPPAAEGESSEEE